MGACSKGRCSLGEDCFCPAGGPRPKRKCKLRGKQLHNVMQKCADVCEDDTVMCKVNFGCNAQKQRARETPAPETPRRTSSLPASPGRKSPCKRAPSMVAPQAKSVAAGSKLAPQARNDARAPKKRHVPANGRTRGPKGGRAVVSKMTLQNWCSACETHRNLPSRNKMTQAAFLRSPLSGDLVNGTRAEQGGFGKMLKRFDRGTLKPSDKKRGRDRQFEDIELKLIEHLDLCARSACKTNVVSHGSL